MKNLILAAMLAVTPVMGLTDSLATSVATTVSMEAAQEDLTATATAALEAQALEAAALEAQIQAAAAAQAAQQAALAQPILSEPFEVDVTFYFPSKRWGTMTASGASAHFGTMAADKSVPFGTQYYIPDLGFIKNDAIFTVEDRGSAVTGNVIDVFLPNPDRKDPVTKTAFKYGRFTTTAYRVLEKAPDLAAK